MRLGDNENDEDIDEEDVSLAESEVDNDGEFSIIIWRVKL